VRVPVVCHAVHGYEVHVLLCYFGSLDVGLECCLSIDEKWSDCSISLCNMYLPMVVITYDRNRLMKTSSLAGRYFSRSSILRPQYSLRGIATYCFFLTSEYLLSFKPLYGCACFPSSDKERNVTSPSIHHLLDVSIDRLASDHQTPHNDNQNIPEPTDRYLRIKMQTELT
jgi:hypothetical protein